MKHISSFGIASIVIGTFISSVQCMPASKVQDLDSTGVATIKTSDQGQSTDLVHQQSESRGIPFSMPMPPEEQDRLQREVWGPIYANLEKAEAMRKSRNFAEAERFVLAARKIELAENPKSQGSMSNLILADVMMAQKRYAEALALYSKKGAWRDGMEYDQAICLFHTGNLDRARTMFNGPDFLDMGRKFSEKDLPGIRTDEALKASLYFARGVNFFYSGRTEDASDDFATAFDASPKSPAICYYLARSLEDLGRGQDTASDAAKIRDLYAKAAKSGSPELAATASRKAQ